MSDDIRETAYHEAGHCVVGGIFGHGCDDASIVPGDGTLGHVTANGMYWVEDDVNRDLDRELVEERVCSLYAGLEERVCSLYAGYAAQVRFAPESAERARLGAGSGAGSDDERAEELLEMAGLATAADRERLRARSAQLVAEHWPAVERIAVELLEHQRLGGQEVEALLEVVRGDSSEEDLARFRIRMRGSGKPK